MCDPSLKRLKMECSSVSPNRLNLSTDIFYKVAHQLKLCDLAKLRRLSRSSRAQVDENLGFWWKVVKISFCNTIAKVSDLQMIVHVKDYRLYPIFCCLKEFCPECTLTISIEKQKLNLKGIDDIKTCVFNIECAIECTDWLRTYAVQPEYTFSVSLHSMIMVDFETVTDIHFAFTNQVIYWIIENKHMMTSIPVLPSNLDHDDFWRLDKDLVLDKRRICLNDIQKQQLWISLSNLEKISDFVRLSVDDGFLIENQDGCKYLLRLDNYHFQPSKAFEAKRLKWILKMLLPFSTDSLELSWYDNYLKIFTNTRHIRIFFALFDVIIY